ncbi:MAG TPA: hypothetical protein VFV38_42525, partial [Ktedonobacteraceae bacterium]|nr:hypothetical protein [Ktedonobacteraceae bacterium]
VLRLIKYGAAFTVIFAERDELKQMRLTPLMGNLARSTSSGLQCSDAIAASLWHRDPFKKSF